MLVTRQVTKFSLLENYLRTGVNVQGFLTRGLLSCSSGESAKCAYYGHELARSFIYQIIILVFI